MAARRRALAALLVLALVGRAAPTTMEPTLVYFSDAQCSGAGAGTTLCRGGTLGAPVMSGSVTTYPNKGGGSPMFIKCARARTQRRRHASC